MVLKKKQFHIFYQDPFAGMHPKLRMVKSWSGIAQ